MFSERSSSSTDAQGHMQWVNIYASALAQLPASEARSARDRGPSLDVVCKVDMWPLVSVLLISST